MTDVEDLDYEEITKKLKRLAPTTAGEFMRAAGISATSLEGFWAEVAWDTCKTALAGPPRLANKASLAKEVHAIFQKKKGMAGVEETADAFVQAWRDAGGTTLDLVTAINKARGI